MGRWGVLSMNMHDRRARWVARTLLVSLLSIGLCLATFLPKAYAGTYLTEGRDSGGTEVGYRETEGADWTLWKESMIYIDGEPAWCVDIETRYEGAGSQVTDSNALDYMPQEAIDWIALGSRAFDENPTSSQWNDTQRYYAKQVWIWWVLQQYRDYSYSIYACPQGGDGDIEQGEWDRVWAEVFQQVVAWNDAHDFVCSGTVYRGAGQTLGSRFSSTPNTGSVSIDKESANPGLSDGNPCYQLDKIRYELWANRECTESTGLGLALDAGGHGHLDDVKAGTYYARESRESTIGSGFAYDATPYPVEVRFGEESWVHTEEGGNPKDAPQGNPIELVLTELDADRNTTTPQGDGALAGAEFTLAYHQNTEGSTAGEPERTWVLAADEGGRVVMDDAHKVSGDGFYHLTDGRICIPRGTLAITETRAPEGYLLSKGFSEPQVLVIDDHEDASEALRAFNPLTAPEQVIRGGVMIGKVDRETMSPHPLGGARLSGFSFDIINKSKKSVQVDGAIYRPGDTVATIITDEQGIARTGSHDLPFGSYSVVESAVGEGYLPNDDWVRAFQVHEDGMVSDLTDADEGCPDQVKRSDFRFTKRDAETMSGMAEIPFLVTSLTTGEQHVIVTDENGQFDSSASTCSHLQRTNANDTALIVASPDAVTEETDALHDGSAPAADAHPAADAGDRTSTADDGQGPDASSQPGEPDDIRWEVDETKLDPEAGIWFSGRSDLETVPDDSLGALPYDTYEVKELRCQANRTHGLRTFTLTLHRDSFAYDLDSIDDLAQHIGTTLTDEEGDHDAEAGPVTLVDTVAYEGLAPGQTYTMTGTLHLVGDDGTDDGIVMDPDGTEVHASQSFVPQLSHGTVEVVFTFDASDLSGHEVVAFETCEGGDGTYLTHEDITDEGQTVSFASIATTAMDATDGDHEIAATPEQTIKDTVHYAGLIPGRRYLMCGTLHTVGEDGEDAGEFTDAAGNTLRASREFVPSESTGDIDIEFAVDGSLLAGHTVVVFEECKQGSRSVAMHADITDTGQTVVFPGIATTLLDTEDGDHEVFADAQAMVTDTVAYRNLTPDKTYTMTGTLHLVGSDGKDMGELKDAEGNVITQTTRFTPTAPNGTIELEFGFDASALAGRKVVAFEECMYDNLTVAVHADIDDSAQTVTFPHIGTTFTDAADGDHETLASDAVMLRDTVAYHNLVPGQEYTMSGVIHVRDVDGEDAGILMSDGSVRPSPDKRPSSQPDADDGGPDSGIPAGDTTRSGAEPVTATRRFIPETPDGTVDLEFGFDATRLRGKTAVAFEECRHKDRIIAVHADISDEQQSVRFPRIGTTLAGSESGSHDIVPNQTTILKDTVAYEGLIPGRRYTLQGTLMDRESGTPLQVEGKTIIANTEFTAQDSDGSVGVLFMLDSSTLDGKTLVAFEELVYGDKTVASHADLDDKGQTVTVHGPGPVAKTMQKLGEAARKASGLLPGTGDSSLLKLAGALALVGLLYTGSALFLMRRDDQR